MEPPPTTTTSPPSPPATDELWEEAVVGDEEDESCGPSLERVFEAEPVPSLSETFTARSVAVSVVLSVTLTVVAMRLGLTSGLFPSLAIPAGLLGFFLPRAWIRLLDRFHAAPHFPFTRQENTVIQTCVVACSTIAFSGGFGTFIVAMSEASAEGSAVSGKNVEDPQIWRLIAFLFLTCFAGMFAILPFRNTLIIRHQLTFPSGTATAHLINSVHTPQGAKEASKQVSALFRTFGASVAWSIFQWFFTGGHGCGFHTFPTFGLDAFQHGFFFDFSMVNVGVGMICPYKITVSILVGSLVSWGIMWPYIETKAGSWYPSGLADDDLSGINGYRVFIGVSMILADGMLHLLSISLRTLCVMYQQRHRQQPFGCLNADDDERPAALSFDDRRRAQVFLRGRIPSSAAAAGYVALSVISTAVIPQLYTQLRYQHVAVAYLVAPLFAFCNAYGSGITDMNSATTYGKVAILAFGSWVGFEDGGVVAGLAACGIVVSTISTASDLMQDFRTGYLTLTSPRAIFISQVAGTALGCVINPVVFWVFYKVNAIGGGGDDGGIPLLPPYAKVYRGIAMLGISENGLPRHSVLLCQVAFALALAAGVLREVSASRGWRVQSYIPSVVGLGVAFFVSPTMPIGLFLGSVVMYLWRWTDGDCARRLSQAVACGLICGDGFGSLLLSMLTLSKARAPICIKFLSRQANMSLDAFLASKAMS